MTPDRDNIAIDALPVKGLCRTERSSDNLVDVVSNKLLCEMGIRLL